MAMIVVLSLIAIITAVAASIAYGHLSWRKGTREVRALLDEARTPTAPLEIDTDLGSLPEPVRRYFRAVLAPDARRVATAHVRHMGTFNMGEVAPNWRPFSSDQYVVTQRPGFIGDARIRMAPGITVHVNDGYITGEGLLRAPRREFPCPRHGPDDALGRRRAPQAQNRGAGAGTRVGEAPP